MKVYSCDTVVALGNSTKSGHVVFAKNSDRPLTEPQPLVTIDAADHPSGSKVRCTYIEIDQVEHTYRVLGSRPFWLWGFEHGVNEHSVVIGNEAVWSKEPVEIVPGLLGMDLVRLGLERGKTAYEAMHVIIGLLERHGQGGNAAYDREHRYHNSFLIADKNEAWILDTVKRMWVARRIEDVAGISNCYSTEEHWDEASDHMRDYAYEKGWAKPGQPFNFAQAYGALDLEHRFAHSRYARLNKLLREGKGKIDAGYMKAILRDHYEGELIAPRWNPADGLHVSICMHAIDPSAGKTAASAVVEFNDLPFDFVWWNSFSNPCTSIFTPIYLTGTLPKGYSTADAKFCENSLWWKMERLNYAVEANYPKFIDYVKEVRVELEEVFRQEAARTAAAAAALKNPSERNAHLDQFMAKCKQQAAEEVDRIYKKIGAAIAETGDLDLQRQQYLEAAKKRAGISWSGCLAAAPRISGGN